jgi:acetyl esterase/lipase
MIFIERRNSPVHADRLDCATLLGTMHRLALLALSITIGVLAQEPRAIRLWEGHAPGALGDQDLDQPTLTFYPAAGNKPSRTAVIIAPGGGYEHLAMNHEGRQVANWFNATGINGFVLKYRLGPRYHHPIELGDAQQALRLVRARAAEFQIDPQRVGMLGFSAGGHLVATVATHFDDPAVRPDFVILAYPVISFQPAMTHAGSVKNLLGDQPSAQLIGDLSNELHVTPQTPPTFLFHTSTDPAVPVANSLRYYEALRKAGVPVELHVFEVGPHGVGLALQDESLGQWPQLLKEWLRHRGLLAN